MSWFVFAALCFAGLVVILGYLTHLLGATFRTGDDGPPDNHHIPN